MNVKALSTPYRGIRFRSRLEAGWAFNLDRLGIAWQYEPAGYLLSNGMCYSPDFYLPECSTWLEVKGDHDERIDKVEQFDRDVDDLVLIGRSPLMPPPALVRHHGHHPDGTTLTWDTFMYVHPVGEEEGRPVHVLDCPACGRTSLLPHSETPCRCCGETITRTSVTGHPLRVGKHVGLWEHLTAPGGRS